MEEMKLMKKICRNMLLIGSCLLLLYGCGTAISMDEDVQESDTSFVTVSTYTPPTSSTAASTNTPSPTATLVPSPTPTIALTPDPTPTESPTPEPTIAPTVIPTSEPTTAPSIADNTESNGSSENNNGTTVSNGGSNFNTYNNAEQQNTEDTWVLNTNSKKIHYPHCKSVPKIAPKNYSTSSESLDELKARGYTTCGNCFK